MASDTHSPLDKLDVLLVTVDDLRSDMTTGLTDLCQLLRECRERLQRLEEQPPLDLEPLTEQLSDLQQRIAMLGVPSTQTHSSWRETIAGLCLTFMFGVGVTLWAMSGDQTAYVHGVVKATVDELYLHQPAKGNKK